MPGPMPAPFCSGSQSGGKTEPAGPKGDPGGLWSQEPLWFSFLQFFLQMPIFLRTLGVLLA